MTSHDTSRGGPHRLFFFLVRSLAALVAAGRRASRFLDPPGARFRFCEQVLFRAAGGKEPVHRAVMGFEATVSEDMRNLQPKLLERAGDQQRPVAMERILLRAHQRQTMLRRAAQDAPDSLAVERCA